MRRFAYVAATVPRRADLSRSPADVDWLLSIRERYEPVVFVDHDSPGSNDLREAGIEVYVSPKRPNVIPGGVTLSADHIQARLLAQEHRSDPLEFVLYSPTATTDLAWFERSLAGLPRGVALADGILGDARLVAADAALFQNFGRRCWASTGFVASADFIVADADPGEFGFKAAGLPERRSTGLTAGLPPADVPAEPPALLAVVATGATDLELGSLVADATAQVPTDERTIVVVIHRDVTVGPEHARDLIADGCPERLRQSTIMMTPGDDGAAAAFLDAADWVVVGNRADLAIRAVADAARRTGYTVLSGTEPVEAPPLEDSPAKSLPSAHNVLVPMTGPPRDLIGVIDGIFDDADFVTLHEPAFAAEARRFIGMPGLGAVDLAVLAYPDSVFGLPESHHPNRHVLGVGAAAWPSVRRRARAATSLFELASWCLDLSLAEHVRLLVLPGTGEGCQPLYPDHIPGLPTWVGSSGILPSPNLVDIGRLAPQATVVAGVENWVAEHGWSDRARLALPWKGGLLERAMRGRW